MWYVENRYKYAICINLTTTCWDYRNFSQADAVDRQEIIGKWLFLSFIYLFMKILTKKKHCDEEKRHFNDKKINKLYIFVGRWIDFNRLKSQRLDELYDVYWGDWEKNVMTLENVHKNKIIFVGVFFSFLRRFFVNRFFVV